MSKIRILYFDDEMWLAQTLQNNLQELDENYIIKLVSSIEDFINELSNSYDLIILDIMAPMVMINENVKTRFSNSEIIKMNNGLNVGEVLYDEIRRTNGYKEIPVLFYSAKRKISIADANFIRKPELATTIDEKIKKLMKNEELQDME